MIEESQREKIVIVGGGLVGTLNALFFAKYDRFDIQIFEKMDDIENIKSAAGRSINLSISHRGLCALNALELEEQILKASIPMFGRMIHNKNGSLKRFPYGKPDQCLWSLDRHLMNKMLLKQAKQNKNIKVEFNSKLVDIDFQNKVAKFSKENEIKEIKYDLLIGNDGAYSTVRQFMSKNMRLDFSQEFIPHGYIELHFPSQNSFLDRNSLHLWPRNEFMLLCMPNLDGSFTGTLFMPFEMFESITSSDKLFSFFEENFSDALEIIGRSNLEKLFWNRKPSHMVTIRCNPYNLGDSCVIMGDAAHAMVPFYGQGMNCGYEDLVIFHEILKNNNLNLGKTCFEFSINRNKDAKAICDLAFHNYVELRKNVTSRSFLYRKMFDNAMNTLFPLSWIPLYSMVCFTRMPYTKCIEEKNKQDKIVGIIKKFTAIFTISSLILATNIFLTNGIRK